MQNKLKSQLELPVLHVGRVGNKRMGVAGVVGDWKALEEAVLAAEWIELARETLKKCACFIH